MGDLKLNLKISQQLVMTPQLQQAIKLLQMSRLEMEQTINTELTENPVLEEDLSQSQPDEFTELTSNTAGREAEGKDTFDWEGYVNTYQSNSSTPPSTRVNKNSEDLPNVENISGKGENLYDHLIWQLRMSGFSEKEEELAELIIENINDDGYLLVSLEDIVKQVLVPITMEEAEEVLLKIQEFDPVGVGARNLEECLIQQVRQLDDKDPVLFTIIKNHLAELEKHDHNTIAKKLKITVEKVKELSKIILSLEPKPGRAFSGSDPQYIVPDIYVVKVDNDFVVVLNDDGLPKLKISNYYKDMLSTSESLDKEAKDFIQEKIRNAVTLIRSIQHRQKTIYKVTESIVKKQRAFFDEGITMLKPMILRDIAEDINMHESTISRVTTNKYVHTPHGLLELKFFFNNPISSFGGGSDVASESVRERIREIVGAEDTKHPLSDQDIVDELKKFNIDLARRTVAKYREMMGILPSSKRKKNAS